ncbi:hypothetical protein [Spiroplasma endosymbiont of Diplazon laetatorius]|uniref:hypothetical protein n=1 Tax=Spiroplasma endosymbiont of Diplazon laetatorius TaxID=3066322 RepID=UPI0030CEABC3
MDKLKEDFLIDEYKNKKLLTFKMLILFAILIVPVVTYLVIININTSLEYYFNNISVVKEYFGKNVVASKFEIIFFAWGSISLFVIGILMIAFLNLFVSLKINKVYKNVYIISIAALAVLSIVFVSISEYSYSKFYNLFEFLSQQGIKDKKLFEGNEEIQKMIDEFTKMYSPEEGRSFKYKWSTDTLTWWLAIFKIILVILTFNIMLKKSKENKTIVESPSRSISGSKVKEFINKFSLNSRKNILFWLIIGTTIVFITPLVYIINMSIFNTQMNVMLSWTFIIKDLYKSIPEVSELATSSANNGSYFVIKFLPIIVSGFLISNILISTVAYIQNWKSSKSTFAVEFLILLIEILFVLIIIAYSAHEAQKITHLWNSGEIKISSEAFEFEYLKSTYGHWDINNGIPEPWMSGFKYISQTVISLSFLATIYIILGVKFKKLNEK